MAFQENKQNGQDIKAATSQTTPHILIIGAGITGLLLAQALRKRHGSSHASSPITTTGLESLPKFSIFERDPNPEYRGAGWGLTVHWALDDFTSLLPKYLVDRIPETYVDREAVERGETGNFLLFDLQDGKEKYRVPPSKRIRVSREKLRALLMDGLDIQWSKTLLDITKGGDGKSITATFQDGTSSTGTLLIGADGSRSQVRKLLCPSNYQNAPLPARFLGASFPFSRKRCEVIRALDPFFFQATDPETNTFMYFSFLNIPATTPSVSEAKPESDNDTCICQVITSWPFRPGFLGRDLPVEVPKTDEARLEWMKEFSANWVEPFRSIVHDIPPSTEIKNISLEDWPPSSERTWDNMDGRVTLMGDAAHAMTMFRGEAANHGIADVARLYRVLFEEEVDGGDAEGIGNGKESTQKERIDRYEEEMIKRGKIAVLTSRKACLDAHEPGAITEASPLVARRVMVFEE